MKERQQFFMVWCRDSRDSMDRQKPEAVADHGPMVSTLRCTTVIHNTVINNTVVQILGF